MAFFIALAETTVFLAYSKELLEHRQPGKVLCLLDEVKLFAADQRNPSIKAPKSLCASGRVYAIKLGIVS
jgi:hypothetical protein